MTTQIRATTPFSEFESTRYMLLTTFRKDGTPVRTPVGVYMIGERLFFLTDPRSGKAKRIRRNPRIAVSPCSMRGAPRGYAQNARARVLDIIEAEKVAHAFAGERPILFHLERLLCDLRDRSLVFVEVVSRLFPPSGPIAIAGSGEAA